MIGIAISLTDLNLSKFKTFLNLVNTERTNQYLQLRWSISSQAMMVESINSHFQASLFIQIESDKGSFVRLTPLTIISSILQNAKELNLIFKENDLIIECNKTEYYSIPYSMSKYPGNILDQDISETEVNLTKVDSFIFSEVFNFLGNLNDRPINVVFKDEGIWAFTNYMNRIGLLKVTHNHPISESFNMILSSQQSNLLGRLNQLDERYVIFKEYNNFIFRSNNSIIKISNSDQFHTELTQIKKILLLDSKEYFVIESSQLLTSLNRISTILSKFEDEVGLELIEDRLLLEAYSPITGIGKITLETILTEGSFKFKIKIKNFVEILRKLPKNEEVKITILTGKTTAKLECLNVTYLISILTI